MNQERVYDFLRTERELAEKANREMDGVARVKHQARYENVYEFLKEMDVLPKFWDVRDPDHRI